MKLPRNNNKLDEIFKLAINPAGPELKGEYFVNMLTGLPSLRLFSHRKLFYQENKRVLGYNVLFRKARWGHFFLEKGICKEMDNLEVLTINYQQGKNSSFTNKIRDYLRCVEKGNLYLGRFNYILMGKPRFLGYFSLSKK